MGWFVAKDGQKLVIRNTEGKRYPVKSYPRNRSKESLEAFCERLNGRANRKALQAIKTRLAFLPVELLEDFRLRLRAEIPTEKDANYHYKNLHRYFLSFFVDTLGLQDPITWKEQEYKWGEWLINQFSPATMRGVIQVANRFMEFLHERLPREISKIEFKPISRAKFKELKARREMEATWRNKLVAQEQILELPEELQAACLLGLYYGLRRAEILGLTLMDVRHGYLGVTRQYGDKPLKGRAKRQTPHWFCTPAKAHQLISALVPMHPDTLGRRVKQYGIEMHDLRRTFITKALDVATPKAVMLAVGHSNIETTMAYLQDDRELNDTIFDPKKAS